MKSSLPGESIIGEYTDKEVCESIEMALVCLFKYPDINVQMLSAALILHDVYARIEKHNGFNFGTIEDIFKNFIKQKENLAIIKTDEKWKN